MILRLCQELMGPRLVRACLIQQILSVFGVYGITIDSRHLCLVADYMFHTGKFVGMNRIGIKETNLVLAISKDVVRNMCNIFNKRNRSRRDGQLDQSIVADCTWSRSRPWNRRV